MFRFKCKSKRGIRYTVLTSKLISIYLYTRICMYIVYLVPTFKSAREINNCVKYFVYIDVRVRSASLESRFNDFAPLLEKYKYLVSSETREF